MSALGGTARRPATKVRGRVAATVTDFGTQRGGETMRTYERPTLTAVGCFKQTGVGTRSGPELVVLRKKF